MSIRVLEGMPAARAHLTTLRTQDMSGLPASITNRLRAVFGRDITPEEAVAEIVSDVQHEGDAAVRDYAERIDNVSLGSIELGAEALEAAYHLTPAYLQSALRLAADRIRAFHEREPRNSWMEWDDDGSALGQMVRPLQRVGVYVPGGTAAYPSSLLMAVIPAQVAGVPDILVTTPPGPHGTGSPIVLAAAHLAGVKRVFPVGGAQAIAALAFGTESVPRVDKIVGAGGLFVTLAKKLVYGEVGIDGLYGPTETLLVADETADPVLVAADLLAQAEHDPLATALLITPSAELAGHVKTEVNRQLSLLARRPIMEESLSSQGAILVISDLDQALELANEYAPEHLCLFVSDPWALVGRVKNAGGIFIGEESSEAMGDYVVGPSHIMPTRGTARFASPLHVGDFVKITSIFSLSGRAGHRLAPAAQAIAQAEGLTAHAASVSARQSSELSEPDTTDEPTHT